VYAQPSCPWIHSPGEGGLLPLGEVFSLPAAGEVLSLPVPGEVLSLPVPGEVLSLPVPGETLPLPMPGVEFHRGQRCPRESGL
jgi:hypothetical protein